MLNINKIQSPTKEYFIRNKEAYETIIKALNGLSIFQADGILGDCRHYLKRQENKITEIDYEVLETITGLQI